MREIIQALASGVTDPLANIVYADAGDVAHVLRNHPEIENLEWVIGSIQEPDNIWDPVKNKRKPFRLYYERVWEGQFGVVKRMMVMVGYDGQRRLRVKTAMVPDRHYWKIQEWRKVWTNGADHQNSAGS